MTDTNRPPLWREMQRRADAAMSAYHPSVTDEQLLAAEIRAVRDYLFPGGRPDPAGVSLDCLTIWDELTAEAERAEGVE